MTDLNQLGKNAKQSAQTLALMSTEQKNDLLKPLHTLPASELP